MLTKKIHHPYKIEEIHGEKIVLILGFYDGVHKGHQKVISEGVRIAKERNLKSCVMTFNRYPGIVYKKMDFNKFGYLTTNERRAEIIEQLGVDYLYEVAFTSSFGSLSPEDFVENYIVNWNAEVVVAGFDYTFGKKEVANMDILPEYSNGRFEVVKVPVQNDQAQKISSTRIRSEVRVGNVEEASKLLGYYYQTDGYVVHGDARGRELGYPTANIKPSTDTIVPKVGVYAVQIKIDGTWFNGMASIGYNITFKKLEEVSIEVNIFDFKKEIYGEDVSVRWIKYLRDEEKFESVDQLIDQLEKDKEDSIEITNNLQNFDIV